MKISIELSPVEVDNIKIALDAAAIKWKAEAEKEEDPQHKSRFLELSDKYAKLSLDFKLLARGISPAA